jgi:hypothetical protein
VSNTVYLTPLSAFGLAVEATPGTPVAATGFAPITKFGPQDAPTYVPDEGYRGYPVKEFGEYLGVESSEYDVEGYAYPSSFGNFLAAIFGQDTVTGSAAPYTHTFTLTGTGAVPSYTLSDYYVVNTRQWPGCREDKLSIKFTPEAGVTYTAHWIGWPSVTATKPTPSFGTNPFFLGWEATASLAGAQDAALSSFSVSIARDASKPLFSAAASQNPYSVFVGPMTADWDMEFYMQSDTEYGYAMQQGTQAVSVTLTQSAGLSLELLSSAVQWTKPTIDRSKDYVIVHLTGKAVYNSTDQGVMQAVLKNSVSTAYTSAAAS